MRRQNSIVAQKKGHATDDEDDGVLSCNAARFKCLQRLGRHGGDSCSSCLCTSILQSNRSLRMRR